MARRTLAICMFIGIVASLATADKPATRTKAADRSATGTKAADNSATRMKLSAAQIVEKNVAARGGLQVWRSVQTLSMMGKMEAGGNNRPTLPTPSTKTGKQMPPPRPADQVQLPFVMELKRPRKVRV